MPWEHYFPIRLTSYFLSYYSHHIQWYTISKEVEACKQNLPHLCAYQTAHSPWYTRLFFDFLRNVIYIFLYRQILQRTYMFYMYITTHHQELIITCRHTFVSVWQIFISHFRHPSWHTHSTYLSCILSSFSPTSSLLLFLRSKTCEYKYIYIYIHMCVWTATIVPGPHST